MIHRDREQKVWVAVITGRCMCVCVCARVCVRVVCVWCASGIQGYDRWSQLLISATVKHILHRKICKACKCTANSVTLHKQLPTKLLHMTKEASLPALQIHDPEFANLTLLSRVWNIDIHDQHCQTWKRRESLQWGCYLQNGAVVNLNLVLVFAVYRIHNLHRSIFKAV